MASKPKIRTDYKKDGQRVGDVHEEFPLSSEHPVLVVGVSERGNLVIDIAGNRADLALSVTEVEAVCGSASVALIGFWPGRRRTDAFILNRRHYVGRRRKKNHKGPTKKRTFSVHGLTETEGFGGGGLLNKAQSSRRSADCINVLRTLLMKVKDGSDDWRVVAKAVVDYEDFGGMSSFAPSLRRRLDKVRRKYLPDDPFVFSVGGTAAYRS